MGASFSPFCRMYSFSFCTSKEIIEMVGREGRIDNFKITLTTDELEEYSWGGGILVYLFTDITSTGRHTILYDYKVIETYENGSKKYAGVLKLDPEMFHFRMRRS